MLSRPMLIALEGIDCAGKGEICKRLVSQLDATLYKTPPESLRAEQDHINATASNEAHYQYFVRAIQVASQEIAPLLGTRTIILDRYWLTTVVYHRVMGIQAYLAHFGDIIMPDVTVYLTVNPEVQAERFKTRGMSPGDKRMDGRQHHLRLMYETVLASETSPVIRFDTSPYTPDESTSLILKELGKL